MSIQEKLTKIAEDMPKVYEAGVEQGRHDEWSEFWDGIQDYGNRVNYAYAFVRYKDDMFYPKYDIKVTNAVRLFTRTEIGNIKQRLIDCGVRLDLSAAADLTEVFYYATTTHLPIIDTTSSSDITYCINACENLVEVEKLILKADGSQTMTAMLAYCPKLERITIEGVIGKNGVNTSRSTKLSKASITSIINALSTTTSGLTVTFSKTAVNNAFSTEEWDALIATRSNWTIALA